MIKLDFLCKCGHPKSSHRKYSNIDFACIDCSDVNTAEDWHKFKLDNLKYLEQLYDQKVKTNG